MRASWSQPLGVVMGALAVHGAVLESSNQVVDALAWLGAGSEGLAIAPIPPFSVGAGPVRSYQHRPHGDSQIGAPDWSRCVKGGSADPVVVNPET